MSEERFSVFQFLDNGQGGTIQEQVRSNVLADEAVRAFDHYITNIAARVLKITQRVIITDTDDMTTMEWKRGEGITFPPEFKGRFKYE